MSALDIAVVLPVHNGGRYVREALDSVLAQTLPPSEIVVIDDGSNDETPAILASYGDAISLLTQPHSGYSRSINRGVASTTATTLAFQDSDDVAVPTKLEVLGAAMERAPDIDAVFGAVVQFASPDLVQAVRRSFVFDPEPAIVELLTTGLIRRDRWELLDGLDASFMTASNVDWFSRMLTCNGRIGHIDDVVSRRRLHDANIGVRQREQKRTDLLSIVRSHIGRQRAVVVDAHE